MHSLEQTKKKSWDEHRFSKRRNLPFQIPHANHEEENKDGVGCLKQIFFSAGSGQEFGGGGGEGKFYANGCVPGSTSSDEHNTTTTNNN